jgi:hypothetical protein
MDKAAEKALAAGTQNEANGAQAGSEAEGPLAS